jgi:hypothetical protein
MMPYYSGIMCHLTFGEKNMKRNEGKKERKNVM